MRREARGAILLLVLSIWLGAARAQQTVLEVIPLKYRSAEQVIPTIKPLLAPGGSVSGMQNRLIVRTTPQNLAELRKILDAIDAMPRRLVISVRQEAAGTGIVSGKEVSGSIGNDRARVTVPGSNDDRGATVEIRRGDDVARARVLGSQSAATDRNVQTVLVLEGGEATIRIGQSVPIRSHTVTQTPQGTSVSESVEYRNADTGFQVRPRVNGDQVTLEISSRRDTVADPNTETFNVQRVETVVSGKLGQWIEIGGTGQNRIETEGESVSRRTGNVSDDRKVFLKVDEVR